MYLTITEGIYVPLEFLLDLYFICTFGSLLDKAGAGGIFY